MKRRLDDDEDGDGEDLFDNAERDYEAIPELDQLDETMLDHEEYDDFNVDSRRAADAEIDKRAHRDDRLGGYLDSIGDRDDSSRAPRRTARKFARRDDEDADDGAEAFEEAFVDEINLEAIDMPLREWIATDRTRQAIKARFRHFLENDAANLEAITKMCANNLASFEVSFPALSAAVPILAIWVADAPRDILEIFDEVANELVLSSELFPAYATIQDEVHVRIRDLPILDNLRDLRQSHLNQLVRVSGVVTRRTGVFPQLKLVKFTCMSCSTLLGPFKQSSAAEVKPTSCPTCQQDGPFKLDQEETVYRNYQKLVVQEAPGTVPPGRVPRHKDVILLADLIDAVQPGEEVEITGVYAHAYDTGLSGRAGFPIFSTNIEANHVSKRTTGKATSGAISEDDKRKIVRLSRDPKIVERIVASIAPSIYGQQHVKRALALAMFGGCAKNIDGKHRIRGDINVLLLGDPGCAKSQLLKYCCGVVPRAVYTTGKGASAVGLTAGVHKDPLTKEWTLEGGALVLADNGLCCIDEFDKMNEQDRTSIHEAMEQQSISISKAGIVTSLQARCSVVAAANPIGGRYDSSATFADNVELTDPILQRFDILCVLQDIVDPVLDEQLATFVVGSHSRAAAKTNRSDDAHVSPAAPPPEPAAPPPGDDDCIPQDILNKYVAYARDTCRPRLQSIDQTKISRLYADLRRESVTCGGVPIAVRHLESLIRMSEAHAKMHLRDHVRDDDVDAAIAVLVGSFISAQKFSVRTSLERGFRKYLTTSADFDELLFNALQLLLREAQTYATLRSRPDDALEVLVDDFEAKARELNVHNLEAFYSSAKFKANFQLSEFKIVARTAAPEGL
ncbi:MCM2/3/5 family-domain-containing protein [Pelagophyceae sp. CCMP2097]|nr:MCM2/3/5 family-domain-containing protein [Pelagophyceae sp. CCMP2097]|mmetsp:Transcript_9782/g.34440  ORF Transcript_9782/g.34440 Transcript_9782/m.34440 type:complete len:849 (+) Transcript_9782:156-2702(+)